MLKKIFYVILLGLVSFHVFSETNSKDKLDTLKQETLENAEVIEGKLDIMADKISHAKGETKEKLERLYEKLKEDYSELLAMIDSMEEKFDDFSDTASEKLEMAWKDVKKYSKDLDTKINQELDN